MEENVVEMEKETEVLAEWEGLVTETDAVYEKKVSGCLKGNNAGVGVVEIILILVVLVALVLIFKNQLTDMVQKAMSALEKSMDGILS